MGDPQQNKLAGSFFITAVFILIFTYLNRFYNTTSIPSAWGRDRSRNLGMGFGLEDFLLVSFAIPEADDLAW